MIKVPAEILFRGSDGNFSSASATSRSEVRSFANAIGVAFSIAFIMAHLIRQVLEYAPV
jgi:hypothetical protein